jgi:choline dehydrogenase
MQSHTHFDYIIVGAGSAGCVLAARLSQNPAVTVLLLEAGGAKHDLRVTAPGGYTLLHRSKHNWGFWTEPQPHVNHRRLFQPRGKTLGGSSATNAMAYIRGNPLDFDDWEAAGNPGWGYRDLLPYFCRSENNAQLANRYHGQAGPLHVSYQLAYTTPLGRAFVAACGEQGIEPTDDFNGPTQEGAGLFQFTIKDGQRQSAASAFLLPALGRPNLTVRTQVHTAKVLLDKNEAVGVEVLTGPTTREHLLARREVVLCAGAFGTPQLLMLSGIGHPDWLRPHGIEVKHLLPGVGQHLHDHLFSGVSALCRRPVGSNHHLKPWNAPLALADYLLNKQGPFTASPLEANAFLRTRYSPERVDLQLHFAPIHLGSDYRGDMYNLATFPYSDGFTVLPSLLRPQSRGYVKLRSANPLDPPIINPNYLAVETDRRLLVEGTKIALQVLEAQAFGPYRSRVHLPEQRGSDEALLEHIKKMVEPIYHPVGTCRMGPGELAVVDDQLRVYGVSRLRVADASVMPQIVSGNTNAACLMIGEKAADLITTGHHWEAKEHAGQWPAGKW